MTLLYVEDDPDDVDLFLDAIGKVAPHTIVHVANSVKDALKKLDEIIIEPDYIFLDMNLPEAPGIELLRTIKTQQGLRTIPVVMFSTSLSPADVNECKKLGALDFVAKPSEFHQLCHVLKEFL